MPGAVPSPARRGLMLVLSSPSGAGKSSIARALLAEEGARLHLSISVTTRQRRPSEVEGISMPLAPMAILSSALATAGMASAASERPAVPTSSLPRSNMRPAIWRR